MFKRLKILFQESLNFSEDGFQQQHRQAASGTISLFDDSAHPRILFTVFD